MSSRRTVSILGSTGSIGTQALDVIASDPERFRVSVLAAGGENLKLIAEQAVDFDVQGVALASGELAALHAALDQANADRGKNVRPEVLIGPDAAAEAAAVGADVVLNAITGSIGLQHSLDALRAGSMLALANKESLVSGGALVQAEVTRPDQIVPIDWDYSAIAHVLRAGRHEDVTRLILTASGGPFRGKTRDELGEVDVSALNDLRKAMAPMVTVNSATLMGEGFDLIQAHILCHVDPQDITVVVHPESVIQSMVEFCDGSTIAQASRGDSRLPIAQGLAWPDRVPNAVVAYAWDQTVSWTFEPVDSATFPAVELSRAAVEESATHPAVLNAANEEAAAAFLDGALPFLGIVDTVARVLDQHSGVAAAEVTLEAVFEAENWARETARRLIARRRTMNT